MTRTEKIIDRYTSIQGPLDTKCHIWTGYVEKHGYGRVYYGGRKELAHRVAWMEHNKCSIGPKIKVCHRCDTPTCINPRHLFLGTQGDNVKDMISKNRAVYVRGSSQWASKLTEDQVLAIKKEYASGAVTKRSIAAKYGVKEACIGAILNGQRWKHVQLATDAARREAVEGQ